MHKVAVRFSFNAIPDPCVFINENSTDAITTKASNKFKSAGFDEIHLLTEYVEFYIKTDLTHSRLLFVYEYNTYEENNTN